MSLNFFISILVLLQPVNGFWTAFLFLQICKRNIGEIYFEIFLPNFQWKVIMKWSEFIVSFKRYGSAVPCNKTKITAEFQLAKNWIKIKR